MTSLLSHLDDALKLARQHGADQADAVVIRGQSRSAMIRQGKAEGIRHAESLSLGLRVFHEGRVATVAGNDLTPEALSQLAERACAMAKVVPPSPDDGLAAQPLIPVPANAIATLDLLDPATPPSMETLLSKAQDMEEAALSHDGITNSSGASASTSLHDVALATSAGFTGQYQRSGHGYGISVLAGTGAQMQRDYAFHSAVHQADLENPAQLGHEAARRALARLNPTRPKTGLYPVLFDPRVAGSLLAHLAGAINGSAIVQEASFLKDKLNHAVFSRGITITDDPTLPRLAGSRPFDGEGTAGRPLNLVEDGQLHHWLLDSRCARKLGLPASNGRANRSGGGSVHPGTSNLLLHAGQHSPEELRHDIKEGVLITELMGSAINMLTGDYSRGGSGFMIRNGEIAEPVSGITVAGNLLDMFARLIPANDINLMMGHHAPTIRIDQMSLAGD
ncbi:modulator protein [Bombella intestini]|uniref:Modulator protein n=1 Tax=Bombella intestini TaxID=1539051 RepID=A0A1S8GR11_9PROT|nr:TldD/PmbA family protein [Bombella intestini]OOL19472.1 modulator protein [Bombella intestini]